MTRLQTSLSWGRGVKGGFSCVGLGAMACAAVGGGAVALERKDSVEPGCP